MTSLSQDEDDTGHLSKPALIRSATSAYASPGRIDLMTSISQDEDDTGHLSKPALIRSATSAYASPGRIGLMTSISQDEDYTNTSPTSSILEVLEQYNH
jgi:hypothetical protein